MARNSGKKEGSSRIRFIMLEADMQDGDLSEITQAIQGALGRRHIVRQQFIQSNSEADGEVTEDMETPFSSEIDAIDGEPLAKAQRSRSPSKRSFATPDVVDVNWNVSPPIEEFSASLLPKSTTDKYLIVLSWFKEVQNESAISANQVYTVFRKLKWSTAIKDFSQPLRDLKVQQLLTGSAKQGFSINHLGTARVEEMKS